MRGSLQDAVNFIAAQQVRVSAQQLLQDEFRAVRLLLQLHRDLSSWISKIPLPAGPPGFTDQGCHKLAVQRIL